MQPFFVNLPLGYIARDRWYLDEFIERRLCPELGLDAAVIAQADDAWHRDVASRLTAAGLACGMHLPFFDLQPGSTDDFILEATRRRLETVKKIAGFYEPRHMVAHGGHVHLYTENMYGPWLERSKETWRRFLQGWPGHPRLFLENGYEKSPQPLADILKDISVLNAGICFDAGHWFSFSGGCRTRDLTEWLAAYRPYIGHLHLHDNDGSSDAHLGLGQGSFPWDEFFSGLAKNSLHPGITLEPHTPEALEASLQFMDKHPEWFS
jgi:sugar phosphate isomerase/epimerase